jgi:hypothetical protein
LLREGIPMAVWPLNSLIPLEEEENRAISPLVFLHSNAVKRCEK